MSYFRVRYEGYLEEEFNDTDEAAETFLNILDGVDASDLIIEEWNEEIGEWQLM